MLSFERGVCRHEQPAIDHDGEEDDSLPPLCKKRKFMLPEEEVVERRFCPSTAQPNGETTVKGETILRMRKQYIAPSQHLHYGDYPLSIVRGEGQYFYDENGVRYLDTTNNVAHVGHCHPKVVEAGAKQMAILNTNSRFLNDKIITYAKRLCATFPEPLNCCFFTNSGSEANDLALQIAEAATGNSLIIALEGAYHGHLTSLKPLSTHKLSKMGREDSPANVCVAPLPDVYRGKHRDPETAGELYGEEIKHIIKESKDGKVSAFIHESLPCCAGQIIPPKGYLATAYKHVHEAGGLCIADEIQVGFGRIGKHFWGFETQDVCPDIVTIGKPMGNGHPVAAVITSKEIAKKFAGSGIEYFNTFGGNPVSMAISEAVLSVVEEEDLQGHAEEVGSYLLQGLEGLGERHPCIGDVRGMGLFLGVEFVKDRESKEPNKEMAEWTVKQLLLDHNIIVLADGMYGNVLKFKPPLCITKDNCRDIIQSLDSVLSSFTQT